MRDFVDRPAGSENPCGVTESFVEAEIDFILHNEGTQEEH